MSKKKLEKDAIEASRSIPLLDGGRRMVFKVRTPSGVWANGQWARREDIPVKLPDRFEHYFETAEYIEEVAI